MNPLFKIAEVARRYIGVREITMNRSPEIAEFWKYTDYKYGMENREPWCCAAVVAWIQIADKETESFNLRVPPKMAAVKNFLVWAQKPENGCLLFGPNTPEVKPKSGDILIFLPHFSHIAIVAEDYNGSNFVRTIEGNTNGAGSREGDGVYEKTRDLDICGTFVRLPAYPKKA